MNIHKALHLRGYCGERLYFLRKEGVMGLISVEDFIDLAIWSLENYTIFRTSRNVKFQALYLRTLISATYYDIEHFRTKFLTNC